MSDTPITLRQQSGGGQARPSYIGVSVADPASEAKDPAERGAHRLIYLAMLLSIALGLLFASDSLVSYSYDLPQNEWTDRIGIFAEEWRRAMENAGLTRLTERIREWVAAIQGG